MRSDQRCLGDTGLDMAFLSGWMSAWPYQRYYDPTLPQLAFTAQRLIVEGWNLNEGHGKSLYLLSDSHRGERLSSKTDRSDEIQKHHAKIDLLSLNTIYSSIAL